MGTGSTVGTIGGAAAGTAIMPGVGTVIGAGLGGLIGGLFDSGSSNPTSTPQGQYQPIDPNVGIGQGSFGLTPDEQAYYAGINKQRGDLQGQYQQAAQALQDYQNQWQQNHPVEQGEAPDAGEKGGGINRSPQSQNSAAMQRDPQYQRLYQQATQLSSQISDLPTPDMSDPGRFAAMAQAAEGRKGPTLDQYVASGTAAPDIYQMQRQNGPQTYDPGWAQQAQTFNMQQQGVDKVQIDPNAGNADYNNYQQERAGNLDVMSAVKDRALGVGGPSPAELQMKQGQDRAISQQAALAASGGQMDAAQARRQAMIGAASIGQKTASDTALLRANEQLSAQNTYGGLSNAQQSADLNARGQTFGQAQARAQNDFGQNLQVGQFLSNQSLQNAQLGMQQSQFNASQANQFNLARANTMAQQSQAGAQFGLSQEQAMAQSMAQQRQFNAQFNNQQNQFNAQFGAQQSLNQANLNMQTRAQNDAYQNMLLNQYMASRGMQQQNAFQNQNSYNQMAGINAGIGINNANIGWQQSQANRQQLNNTIGGIATGLSGYMSTQGGGSSPAVANSGFNQSNPSQIDWGY